MADKEAARKSRKARKAVVTRECNRLQLLVVQEEEDAVKASITVFTGKFRDFELSHEEYHNLIGDDNEEEQEGSQEYYDDVHVQYVKNMIQAKDYLRGIKAEQLYKQKADVSSTEVTHVDLLRLVNLPKVEIEPFDGNPASYHNFVTLFHDHVGNTKLEPASKLARLLHYTRGEARDAIRPCVMQETDGYREALSILKRRFGNSLLITQSLMQSIKSGKAVGSAKELQRFSDELHSCYMTLQSMGELRELDTQASIVEMLSRLKPYITYRWVREVMDYKRAHDKYPGLSKFVEYIRKQAEDANDPIYGQIGSNSSNRQQSVDSKPKKTASYRTDTNTNAKPADAVVGGTSAPRNGGDTGNGRRRKPVTIPCVVCKEMHRLFYCDPFRKMSVPERLEIVRKHSLCENCLLNNHTIDRCKNPAVCSIFGCGKKHTKFIHQDAAASSESDNTSSAHCVTVCESESINVSDGSDTKTSLACNKPKMGVVVPIVKVCVNSVKDVHVLLDNASTATFCSQRLVDELQLKGVEVEYKLNTISAVNESKRSVVVDMKLTSYDGSIKLNLNDVHVVGSIPVNMPRIDLGEYDHLSKVEVTDLEGVQEVDILLGQDHAEALIPLEVRKGGRGNPFAVRTMFGWSLNGPVSTAGPVGKRVMSHFVCTGDVDADLMRLWEIESDGFGEQLSLSNEDREVIKLWDANVRLEGGHYELPVPWRPGMSFPNNIYVASNRLDSLLKNLTKRDHTARYDQEIKKLLDQGYAELVPDPEILTGSHVWYLPHHAVVTPKKPGKVRVVFDCAAKYRGESLNDKVFQGPDLNNKLVSVLLRFRENPVAIMADIEAMYNQVRIPVYDRDALRFLWCNGKGDVVHYRMTSHLFGGVWCASSSTYALRRVLVDKQVGDQISKVVKDSFYVDDCLDSVQSDAEAAKIIFGTKEVLGTAGFNLTKFISNSQSVMAQIPESDRAKEAKEFECGPQSKALGVRWDVQCDEFYYVIDIDLSQKVTKRSMLSTVASMYDPLGLMGPLVIAGRLVLQDVVRLKVSWDDQIESGEILDRWRSWTSALVRHISRFRFPRCVKPLGGVSGDVELHHFSDASSKAYGCCSYVRYTGGDGCARVTLLMAKGRVAPMKQVTIPRLELQAAVLSAKADAMLRSELRLTIPQSYFWTDSEIVLAYLRNNTSRFHVFVGNRVSIISSLTKVEQWHHVSGAENPADLITRVQCSKSMDLVKWIQGPAFLLQPSDHWPKADGGEEYDLQGDPEVKRVSSHMVQV